MTRQEMKDKVRELKELKNMAKELEAEISAIEDELKAELIATDKDEVFLDEYHVTYKNVTSSRFDSTAFKKAHPEMVVDFTKTSTSRRFTVS